MPAIGKYEGHNHAIEVILAWLTSGEIAIPEILSLGSGQDCARPGSRHSQTAWSTGSLPLRIDGSGNSPPRF